MPESHDDRRVPVDHVYGLLVEQLRAVNQELADSRRSREDTVAAMATHRAQLEAGQRAFADIREDQSGHEVRLRSVEANKVDRRECDHRHGGSRDLLFKAVMALIAAGSLAVAIVAATKAYAQEVHRMDNVPIDPNQFLTAIQTPVGFGLLVWAIVYTLVEIAKGLIPAFQKAAPTLTRSAALAAGAVIGLVLSITGAAAFPWYLGLLYGAFGAGGPVLARAAGKAMRGENAVVPPVASVLLACFLAASVMACGASKFVCKQSARIDFKAGNPAQFGVTCDGSPVCNVTHHGEVPIQVKCDAGEVPWYDADFKIRCVKDPCPAGTRFEVGPDATTRCTDAH